MKKHQRLFFALSKPLTYLGLSLDEWFVFSLGLVPGVFFVNSGSLAKGLLLIISGFFLCFSVKKYKNLTGNFLIKSWLLAKFDFWPSPSKRFLRISNKRMGK